MQKRTVKPKIDYSLYLVTDRDLMSAKTLDEAVEKAILGGATLIQFREKKASSLEFYTLAVRIKKITDRYGIPLIVNDRVDIALASDASGVHVGQSDLPASAVRRMIGAGKILGVSASSLNEAEKAQRDGADYLGVGAMFATGTKTDAELMSMEELKKIRAAVTLPLVVIGGINTDTIRQFHGTGIDGISVVSAILSETDIASAAKELKKLFLQIKRVKNA